MDPQDAFYLGDGAYVKEGSYTGEIVLFTHDGLRTTNQVVLEPHGWASLKGWLQRYKAHIKEASSNA